MNEVNSAKAVLISASGAAGVVFTKIFGSLNDDLLSLILLMIIDFITAFILAALFRKSTKTINGGLSSRACMQGIAKKVAGIMLVAVAYRSEQLLGVDYLRVAVIWGLCAAEIISILENAGRMGILPKGVQKTFEKIIDTLNGKNKE